VNAEYILIICLVQAFVLLFGISVGRSLLLYRIRKEENRRKEMELSLLEKRAEIITEGKKIATNLEELLYKAQVQKEIDDIIRKGGKR